MAFLAGHSTDYPSDLDTYELCLEFHLTPQQMRAMPAKDYLWLTSIRRAKLLAQLEWGLCNWKRGGGAYPECPRDDADLPFLDYLSSVCQKCIEAKTISHKKKEQAQTEQINKMRTPHRGRR